MPCRCNSLPSSLPSLFSYFFLCYLPSSFCSCSVSFRSVGCTIIELLTGYPPYYNMPPVAALFSIVQVCRHLPPLVLFLPCLAISLAREVFISPFNLLDQLIFFLPVVSSFYTFLSSLLLFLPIHHRTNAHLSPRGFLLTYVIF